MECPALGQMWTCKTKGVAFFDHMSYFWVEKKGFLSVKLLGMPTDVKQARERLPQPTRVVLHGET